jgi:MobI protein
MNYEHKLFTKDDVRKLMADDLIFLDAMNLRRYTIDEKLEELKSSYWDEFSELENESKNVWIGPSIEKRDERSYCYWYKYNRTRGVKKNYSTRLPMSQKMEKRKHNRIYDRQIFTSLGLQPELLNLVLRYEEQFAFIRCYLNSINTVEKVVTKKLDEFTAGLEVINFPFSELYDSDETTAEQ